MSIPPVEFVALRFLVVEDQGFQRWALGNLLERLGALEVFSAEDGTQALAILADAANRVDVVVSDLDMPGMDGMELIRHLAGAGKPVSLILASGLDAGLVSSVSAMAQEYGVALLGTVDKPVTEKKMREVVARYRAPPVVPRRERAKFTREEIQAGLARGEIEAFFQPKIDLASGAVVGAEALARWRHPSRGIVGPAEFIPVLEAEGGIHELTMAIIEDAARNCARWSAAGHELTVAVNLSTALFTDISIVDDVLRSICRHGVSPRSVTVEVTESAMAADLARALEICARLRMNQFGLSIDDYGTGYSSLQQLSRIAFTELKVDRGFVRDAPRHRPSMVVLESSLEIAAKLGIVSVAEGVETRQEAELLRTMGCGLAQGYYYARPMPAGEILAWLRGPVFAGD